MYYVAFRVIKSYFEGVGYIYIYIKVRSFFSKFIFPRATPGPSASIY